MMKCFYEGYQGCYSTSELLSESIAYSSPSSMHIGFCFQVCQAKYRYFNATFMGIRVIFSIQRSQPILKELLNVIIFKLEYNPTLCCNCLAKIPKDSKHHKRFEKFQKIQKIDSIAIIHRNCKQNR